MSTETTSSAAEEARRLPWRAIGFAILALLMTAALYILWQQVVRSPLSATHPAAGAGDVSLATGLRLEFREPMDTGSRPRLQATPAISATHTWLDSHTLLFRPHLPLQAETKYLVEISGDLWTAAGRRVTAPISWQFQTGTPRILYLSLDDQRRSQLVSAFPAGDSATALTGPEFNVVDYAISTSAAQIAYIVQREDGASDIRIMNRDGSDDRLVLQCLEHLCTNAVWEPGDRRLMYERRALSPNDAPPGPPQLWWLDPVSGETAPVLAGDEAHGMGPRFSADGSWLSFNVPNEETALVYNLRTGETLSVANGIGEPADWHPFQNHFLTTDIEYQGEHFGVHIYGVNTTTRRRQRLSQQEETNDASPTWSPDGEWIAFTSKVPRAPTGRQLYLMRADGSGTQRLTSDPEINYGPPRWSPDGRQLLFQQYNISEPETPPSVWLLDIESGQLQHLSDAAYQPRWLP